MAKLNSEQSSVSRDPNMQIYCSKNIISINFESSLLNSFLLKLRYFGSLINKKFKIAAFIWNGILL